MAVSATSAPLTGLPRRLVQDGIIDEEAVLAAVKEARSRQISFVAHLVENEQADPRKIAIAASHEFGVPMMDIEVLELDLDAVRKVDQKLITKHRVLPLILRGKRLFLGVSDPTNLASIDDIKFQTGCRVDPVVVEQDKLDELVNKALEAVDTSMSNFDDDDFDLESLEISGGEDEIADEISRDDVEDAPVVRFVNKILLDAIKRGASDVHFEPYEKAFPCPHPSGRGFDPGRRTPDCIGKQGHGAPESHVAHGYRRAPSAAGWPHQDEAVEKPGNRFSRQHLSDPVWREGRVAYPGSEQREIGHRCARLRTLSERSVYGGAG